MGSAGWRLCGGEQVGRLVLPGGPALVVQPLRPQPSWMTCELLGSNNERALLVHPWLPCPDSRGPTQSLHCRAGTSKPQRTYPVMSTVEPANSFLMENLRSVDSNGENASCIDCIWASV